MPIGQLDRSGIRTARLANGRVIVEVYENHSQLQLTVFELLDLPNDLVGPDDLKRVLVDEVGVAPIGEAEFPCACAAIFQAQRTACFQSAPGAPRR
jgi:hypothetical protein